MTATETAPRVANREEDGRSHVSPEAAPRTGRASDIAEALNREMRGLSSLEDRIGAIERAIAGRIAFSTSLGLEDQAVTHAIAQRGPRVDIFTLDTGRHFPETFDTLFETEARYGIKIRVMFPDAKEVESFVAEDGIYGFRYSIEARKACCEIRKVRPLNRALAGAEAWVTGLRRDQSQGRADVPFAAYDPVQNLIKVNPIADWSLKETEDYIAANKIPVNPLHARGFPSIGCQPCTRAIAPGEDIRAGRWWWENENGKECGLHRRNSDAAKDK